LYIYVPPKNILIDRLTAKSYTLSYPRSPLKYLETSHASIIFDNIVIHFSLILDLIVVNDSLILKLLLQYEPSNN